MLAMTRGLMGDHLAHPAVEIVEHDLVARVRPPRQEEVDAGQQPGQLVAALGDGLARLGREGGQLVGLLHDPAAERRMISMRSPRPGRPQRLGHAGRATFSAMVPAVSSSTLVRCSPVPG